MNFPPDTVSHVPDTGLLILAAAVLAVAAVGALRWWRRAREFRAVRDLRNSFDRASRFRELEP